MEFCHDQSVACIAEFGYLCNHCINLASAIISGSGGLFTLNQKESDYGMRTNRIKMPLHVYSRLLQAW